MRRPMFSLCCLAGLACLMAGNSACAQSGGGSGWSQLFGGSGGGGSSSGGGGSRNNSSSFNSSSGGSGGSRNGGGGAGSSMGGNGSRAGAQGAGGFGGNTGMISAQDTGFIGRNGDLSTFLGASEQGRANAGGNGGRGGQRSFGGGGGQRGLENGILNQMNGQNAGTSQQPTIRPRLKANFSHPPANLQQVLTDSQSRFDNLSTRFPHLAGVQVSQAEAGKVVLTGEVASADAAKLAASILRLEPGVRSIQNNLTYPPPVASAE